jgi:hypothetical protein
MGGEAAAIPTRPRAAEPASRTDPLMTRKILIIDSDDAHAAALAATFRTAGFSAVVVPHEDALAHLSDRTNAYDSLVVCATSEPSTLSSEVRLGEFVLRFVAHATPHLLARTIVLSTMPPGRREFPAVRAVFDEPFDATTLIAEVRACSGE